MRNCNRLKFLHREMKKRRCRPRIRPISTYGHRSSSIGVEYELIKENITP
jgi:hypothetical protein